MADITKINLKGTVLTVKDADAYHTGDLATVATSGSYDDLTDKPTIPAAQVNSDWNASSGMGEILNKPTLATVATSGAYSDLLGAPTIPTVDTSITQNSTNAAQSGAVYTALAGKQATLVKGTNLDATPTNGSDNPVTSDGVYDALAGKQNTLTFDNSPTSGSNNPVKSGGVYTALAGKQATLTSSDTLATINGTALYYGGSVTIQGDKGDKGDTGDVQVDGNGNVLIYNGLDKTTTGAALDASQGQYIGKMLNAKDSNFYKVWVGTSAELEALDGDYEDNTIYLVGAVATIPTKYDVTKTGISEHITVSGTNASSTKATEGKAFTITLTAASGYTIDTVTVTMNSTDITSTAYNSSTGVISIASVTGAIVITATASIHISSITIAASAQDGNNIGLTATVSPSGAENVTLAWSLPSGTTKFSISGSGASATLTLLNGATTSDSVIVTCADTNASSGTATGTLTVTPTSDFDDSVPISEITDISATRTAANTMTLSYSADGNTPAPTFSIVGAAPTVDKVVRTTEEVEGETVTTTTVETEPAVVISGNTLTYKDNCQVQIKATSGNIEYTKTITITHDNADNIWFEDDVVKGLLLTAGWGSNNEITYTQATASVGNQTTNQAVFKNNKTIKRFNEWKWFTNSQFNVSGCSNLESVKLPKISATNDFDSRFGLNGTTALTQVEIPSGYTAYGASTGSFSASPIQGNSITSITFPSSMTSMKKNITSLPYVTEIDLSGTSITTIVANLFTGTSSALARLNTVKLPNTLTTITTAQTFKECAALKRIEFGTGFTGASQNLYGDGAFMTAVAMTYVFHSTTPPSTFTFGSNQTNKRTVNKILVPRSAVDTYKGTTSPNFAQYESVISAIEDEEV